MQKLYCYVDESGQDTEGQFFVVGVVILEQNREKVLNGLEHIEIFSGKRNIKWHKSRQGQREKYLQNILQSSLFKDAIFFKTFTDDKHYLTMTSHATAKAILQKARGEPYIASIYIDGLREKEVIAVSRELHILHIRKKKVKGVRKDENSAFIRLADAICGLVRDAQDGREWASVMLAHLLKSGIVIAL